VSGSGGSSCRQSQVRGTRASGCEYNVGGGRPLDRCRNADFAARLFGGRPEHALALLRAAWPIAVGPDVARRTEVVALDRGILRIKVPDAGWQRSLLRMRGEILARLRGVAGGASPRGLGFIAGAVTEAPVATAPPPPPPFPPAPAAVVEAAAAIPDPEIRALFLEAARRYLARLPGDRPGAPER
jgi:hypothetical protein